MLSCGIDNQKEAQVRMCVMKMATKEAVKTASYAANDLYNSRRLRERREREKRIDCTPRGYITYIHT